MREEVGAEVEEGLKGEVRQDERKERKRSVEKG